MRDLYEITISPTDDKFRPPMPAHMVFTLKTKVATAATYPDAFGAPSIDELHEAWVYTAGVLGRIAAVVAANTHPMAIKHECWARDDCGACGVVEAVHLTTPGYAESPPAASLIRVAVPKDQFQVFHEWFQAQVHRIGEADGPCRDVA